MYLSKVKQRIILNCVQRDWKQKDSIQLQNDFELFAKINFKTFFRDFFEYQDVLYETHTTFFVCMHIKYQKYYFTRTFAHNSFTYHLYSSFKPTHQCFTLKLMRTYFMILTLGNFPLSQLGSVTLILDEMILMSST